MSAGVRRVLVAQAAGEELLLWEVDAGTATATVQRERRLAGDERATGAAVLLLAADRHTLRHWVLPASSAAQARQMAALQARQSLPWPPDDAWTDLRCRRLDDGRWAVLLAALHRPALDRDLERLARAGLGLAGVAFEPLLWAGLAPAQGAWVVRSASGAWVVRDGAVTGGSLPGGALVERWLVAAPRDPGELPEAADAGGDGPAPVRAAAIQVRRGEGPGFEELLRRGDLLPASPRRLLLAAAALALALGLAATLAWTWLAAEEAAVARLGERSAALHREASASRALAVQVAGIQRDLLAVRARQAARMHQSALLRQVLDVLPAGVRLLRIESGNEGSLALDGEARTGGGPLQLMELLRQAGGRTPALEALQRQDDGSTRFRLVLGARPAADPRPAGAASAAPARGGGDADL